MDIYHTKFGPLRKSFLMKSDNYNMAQYAEDSFEVENFYEQIQKALTSKFTEPFIRISWGSTIDQDLFCRIYLSTWEDFVDSGYVAFFEQVLKEMRAEKEEEIDLETLL